MKKFTQLIAASVMGFALVAPASADFVLDSFTYFQGSKTLDLVEAPSLGEGLFPNSATLTNPLASFFYEFSGDGAALNFDPQVIAGNGVLQYISGNAAAVGGGNVLPVELSITATPNQALDFSLLGQFFAVTINSLDLSDGFTAMATLLSDGVEYSVTKVIDFSVDQIGSINNVDGPFEFLIPFSDFLDVGNNAYTSGLVQETNLTLMLDSDDVDFEISQISIVDVPEPAALGLLGLGLVALSLRRRKLI